MTKPLSPGEKAAKVAPRTPSQREIRDSHLELPGPLELPAVTEYVETGESETRGHPFIEVFGRAIVEAPLFQDRTATALPPCPPGGTNLLHNPVLMALRLFALSRVVYPTPNLTRLNYKVLEALSTGYLLRNPLVEREYQRTVYTVASRKPAEVKKYVMKLPNIGVPSFLVQGASGMGKSYGLEHVLIELGVPQAVQHKEYQGRPFNYVQVIWLDCQCPPTGSLRGLLFEILARLDMAAGTNYYVPWFNSRANTDLLLLNVALILYKHSVGLLVLDELQHLLANSSKDTEELLNFFVALMNFLRIPIASVGTYAALDVLSGTIRDARRLTLAGSIEFKRHEKAQRITRRQQEWYLGWLPGLDKHPITEAMHDHVYDIYQGFQFLMPNLVQRCCVEASFRGVDHITPEILDHYLHVELKPLSKILIALRDCDVKVIEQYEDAISPEKIKALKQYQSRRDKARNETTVSDTVTGGSSRAKGGLVVNSDFPDGDIGDEEILLQCAATKELFGRGDLYVNLSRAGLIAKEIAYGRLPNP